MQVESKDGEIRFFFEKKAQTEQEEEAQKKAVLSAIKDIRKMEKTDWKLIIIVFIFFSSTLAFHYYSQKIEKNPEYEQIQSENLQILGNIEKQILDRKAEELGFQKLHENNPEIIDYINLYILPSTIIYDLETERPTTYKGVALAVPSVKLRDGKTVFEFQKRKYYIKD